MLPYGPYRPDIAETNPGVSQRVLNVNVRRDAQGVSYHPRNSLAVTTTATALPDDPRGAIAVVTRAGAFRGFFGTASTLQTLTSSYGFTQIGSGYAVPVEQRWGMAQYGSKALFTNTFDGMKQYDIELGGAVSAVPNAPKARFIFTWLEAIFALDCDGDNMLMRNSAPGSYVEWKERGAAGDPFADGEALMGGGTLNEGAAVVIQRGAVRLLTATGNTNFFRIDKIADGIGATCPECIVQAPGAVFFFDNSGFFRVTAQGLEAIGEDKVNRTFLANLASTKAIEGACDPIRRQVAWRYQKNGAPDDVWQNIIVYDIATGEFFEVEDQTTALLRMSAAALTLEDLNAYGSLETLPYSLDSDAWKGGRPSLSALNADRKFGFFDGPTLQAEIDTAALTSLQSMMVTWATPMSDDPSVQIALGVRDRLADEVTWKEPQGVAASGRIPLRGRGKIVTARAIHPAASPWSYDRGLDGLVMAPSGVR